jgi:hypothetical protein
MGQNYSAFTIIKLINLEKFWIWSKNIRHFSCRNYYFMGNFNGLGTYHFLHTSSLMDLLERERFIIKISKYKDVGTWLTMLKKIL